MKIFSRIYGLSVRLLLITESNVLRSLDHWHTFRIFLSHTNDECFFVETKLNDTIHVIYQVVKGFDNYVRANIADPVGKLVFTQVAEPFGWYSEESTNIAGRHFYANV